MYPNLEDKEILKTFPSKVLSDNFASEEEKSSNVNEKHNAKNYEWSTEVRNGVHYNRLDKVKKLPDTHPPPEENAGEQKHKENDEKVDSLGRCNQNVCLALLFFLVLLSLCFSFYIWYLCTKEKQQTLKEENIGAISTNENIFENTSPYFDKSSHTTLPTRSSSTISESLNDSRPTGLYFPS